MQNLYRYIVSIMLMTILVVSAISVYGFSLDGEFRKGVLAKSIATPEFTHTASEEWLNSDPLKLRDLKGKVVLIDFWTFECWNCYRSFPWLNALQKRLESKGLQVIGVHSPEFDRERNVDSVREKMKEFKLNHPVMIDNDFSYWRAMRNRFWPAFYVLDKQGRTRGIFVGEMHKGTRRAKTVEQLIERLLAKR